MDSLERGQRRAQKRYEGWNTSAMRQDEKVGAVQPREEKEKAAGGPQTSLSVLTGGLQEDGERLYSRACCDRTREIVFN